MRRATSGLVFPDADTFMFGETNADGEYQRSHLDRALAYVTDWSCAIDGGAHVGSWTLPMAQRFARVIACEPSPDTFACLLENIRAAQNIDARSIALGSAPGSMRLTLDDLNAKRGNLGARHLVRANGSIPVQTIDSWNVPSCGFIKLDIEGSEPAALRGAKDTIRRCRPIVLFEDKALWKRYFSEPSDAVAKLLTSYGYRHLERVSCDEIWGPR